MSPRFFLEVLSTPLLLPSIAIGSSTAILPLETKSLRPERTDQVVRSGARRPQQPRLQRPDGCGRTGRDRWEHQRYLHHLPEERGETKRPTLELKKAGARVQDFDDLLKREKPSCKDLNAGRTVAVGRRVLRRRHHLQGEPRVRRFGFRSHAAAVDNSRATKERNYQHEAQVTMAMSEPLRAHTHLWTPETKSRTCKHTLIRRTWE